MQLQALTAVILAGNDEDPNILGGVGQTPKFFMPLNGETIADRTIRAIDESGCCKAICIAAPPGTAQRHTFDTHHPLYWAPQGPLRTGSLKNALDKARQEGQYRDGDCVLVITGDLPLLSASALARFVASCRQAPEADLFMGMVPAESIPEALRPAYHKDLLPFCGGSCLHSDVYLMRPAAVTAEGYARFEKIITIRRANLGRLRDTLGVIITIVGIVGLPGLLALGRILIALARRSRGKRPSAPRRSRPQLDAVERITMGLIEKRFGPKVSFVMIEEPSLALEFDHAEQLALLAEHARQAASDQ